jgi:alkanesulfonate monooxygenase SsuD/methylene tetrahydromethanopterin reductase-like flavin-dependent oxidoreductase (luciferase family)
MRFGVTMFLTDLTMGPVELARAVEERGLHSLYVPEHTHIPTSRRTPPPTGDDELRDEYKRTLDPFVALAMAAAATERLVVGTGICLVAQRDPIVTARRSRATSCRGRFVLGVGFGWNADGSRITASRWSTGVPLRASTCWRCARCGTTTSVRSTASSCRSRRRGRGPSRSTPVGRRC